MAYGYIYKIENLVNGKIYIGQHRYEREELDGCYWGSGALIKAAIKKYGKENFKREVLTFCDSDNEMNEKETYFIELYESINPDKGYNMCLGGYYGIKIREYWKNASESVLEKRRRIARENGAKSKLTRTGVSITPEQRAKLSKALTGHRKSEEHKKKLAEASRRQSMEIHQCPYCEYQNNYRNVKKHIIHIHGGIPYKKTAHSEQERFRQSAYKLLFPLCIETDTVYIDRSLATSVAGVKNIYDIIWSGQTDWNGMHWGLSTTNKTFVLDMEWARKQQGYIKIEYPEGVEKIRVEAARKLFCCGESIGIFQVNVSYDGTDIIPREVVWYSINDFQSVGDCCEHYKQVFHTQELNFNFQYFIKEDIAKKYKLKVLKKNN